MTGGKATDEASIRRVVRRINELWADKRYDEIGELLAEDVVIAPPGLEVRVRGRDAYVQSYRDYDAAATTHEFAPGEPQVDVVGDAAVAVCPFYIVYERDGRTYRENGRDLLFFSRQGGRWCVAWRTMVSEPAPESPTPPGGAA